MGTVVSLLWPKHLGALQQYVARVPSNVKTLQDLYTTLPIEATQTISTEALARTRAIAAELEPSARTTVLMARLPASMARVMTLISALDQVHERDGVELLVLNEDITIEGKTAAVWAKERGVPSVVISHSEVLGRLYTIHREDNVDCLAVYGPRGAQPYEDMGVSGDRIFVTGNPSWDVYGPLSAERAAIRRAFMSRYGIADHNHIVVFATTWCGFFTAFCDANVYERTLRSMLRSVRELRDLGVPIQVVIKERPSNADKVAARSAIVREEAVGFTPLIVDGELEKWIVAADAVVSVDSNISIESMIAGTPAINLWSPMSWLNGPFFDAEDGVLQASSEHLSISLARVLGSPELRSQLLAQARARTAQFAVSLGAATAQVASLLEQTRKPLVGTPRGFVWQRLSPELNVSEYGGGPAYDEKARNDMISMISRAPKVVLDVKCGAGATGGAIKQQYPASTVVGVEINRECAALTHGRIDRVIVDDIETMDFEAAGLTHGSIDLAVFPDVLERLYDPWRLLVRLKPFFAPEAQVIASIPNTRNAWLLNHITSGNWQYAEEGLLEIANIRFFTRKTIMDLFQQTGYEIRRLFSNPDGRVPALQAPPGARVNVEMGQIVLKNMSQEDLMELRTLQFLVDASPLSTP